MTPINSLHCSMDALITTPLTKYTREHIDQYNALTKVQILTWNPYCRYFYSKEEVAKIVEDSKKEINNCSMGNEEDYI